MTTYSVNFVKDPKKGNSIVAGDSVVVSIDDPECQFAQIAVYVDGLPISTDFDDNKDGKVQCIIKTLKWKGKIGDYDKWEKGTYVLKTRAYINQRMQGWDDAFEVI